jgi:hypothetical protein
MNLCITLPNIPELASLPRKEQRRVHAQCLQRYFWSAGKLAYFSFYFMVLSGILAGGILSKSLGLHHPSLLEFCVLYVSGFLGALAGAFLFSRLSISALRPHYAKFVVSQRESAPFTRS